jgi:hypothetical protein
MADETGNVGLAEAPAETGTETVGTGQEAVGTGESTQETGDESNTPQEKEGLTGKEASKGKVNLADVVKKSGEALKAINPALPAAIRTAAFELSGLYREFPGGLREAVAAKQALSEYGGVEGLKEDATTISEMGTLARSFLDGKPEFIDNLIKESPAAFSQIMPAGLEKWRQADPDMYNHVQARVMMQTLDGAKFSDTLSTIWERLGDDAEQKPLKDAIAQMWQTLDGYRKAGDKAPEQKVNPQDEALTRREQELAQRETRALLSPIANEGKRQLQTVTEREMNQSYQWSATGRDVQEAVIERVRQEVIKVSSKDKAFVTEFERLKARGDSAGLSRHVKNFQDRVTPSVVQRVAKLFAVKPKGAGPQIVKKPAGGITDTAGKPAERGWEKISAQPKPSQINYSAMGRSPEDMIMSNKAILKDGRKVTWQ